MNTKLRQISRLLKRYDSDLFPKKFLSGATAIMRKRRDWDFYRFGDHTVLWFARDWADVIIPVTDNWNESGMPVDWGIEPILSQLQKQDSWRDDGDYDRFCRARQARKEDKARAFKNEVKAIAADCRTEFARATNDINTSTLEKIDIRRAPKWQ